MAELLTLKAYKHFEKYPRLISLSASPTTLYTDKLSSFPGKLASNNSMASDWMKQISNQSEALTRSC